MTSLIGWSKLHTLCFEGNYEKLYEELNRGSNPNLTAEEFISYGDYKKWWKFDKTLRKVFTNMTPLYIAAQRGHKKCVKLLMERGADPNAIIGELKNPKSSFSALETALLFNNYKCYRLMKKIKAKEHQLLNESDTRDNL